MQRFKTYLCVFIFVWLSEKNFGQQSTGMFSVVLDPKMAITGPYPTSKHGELDVTLRLGVHKRKYEVGLFSEIFYAIDYYSFGIFYNRKFIVSSDPKANYDNWVVPIGVDFGVIKRNVKRETLHVNFSLNGSLRYYFHKNWGIEGGVNYNYRADLEEIYRDNKPMRMSGFLGVITIF